MKKHKLKALMAELLTLCMLLNVFTIPAAADSGTATPAALTSGIEFTKTATLAADGSVDITMEAWTTGTVINTQSTVPTDIILVLDVSGSMDWDSPNPVDGATYRRVEGGRYYEWLDDKYGFDEDSSDFHFVHDGTKYITVFYAGRDNNDYEYYRDINGNFYYPTLESGLATNRANNYPVMDFYVASDYKTHMQILKEGAGAFIAETARKNAAIANPDDMHRISIIKFADDSYYSGSGSTQNYQNAVQGDNKSGSTNYTQVVKGFTAVDASGASELTTALNSLTAGGATAVDYGMQLAVAELGNRPQATVLGRKAAVIVFTDGDPTHSDSYSSIVAGTAINHAKGLKSAGVTIYTIGGADEANSAILGDSSNQFMHYMSNNYPSASATVGSWSATITAGAGSVSGGYYMAPTDDKKLDDILLKSAVVSVLPQ